MSKKLHFRLFALVAAMMCALSANAAADVCDFSQGGIFYKIQSDGTSVYVWYEDGSSWDPCYLLDHYGIPETVTYNGTTYTVTGIGHTAFYGCTALTHITLPPTITNIVAQAFTGCTSLNTIYCYAVTPPSLYSNAFDATAYDNVVLYVPESAVSTYKTATNWKYFSDIQPIVIDGEAYACYTSSNTTLTFYYDDLRSTRTGKTYDLGDWPGWFSDGTSANVTKAVITSSFANARPTYTSLWFYDMENLQSITGMQYLNTSEVTDMSWMFADCKKLESLDVSHFNTAKVTDMRYMFRGCKLLTSLDVSNFNTSKVTSMESMFGDCSGLTSLDVSNFNTANVTNMSIMFSGCNSLISLDVSNFNTAKVTDMSHMFRCKALKSIDLSSFNTSNVTKMGYMFYTGNALTSLDLSSFNTSKVTDMWMMFCDCYQLNTIYVGDGWSTAAVTGSGYMFSDCTNIVGGKGTTYDADHVDAAYAHIDGGPSNPGYLTARASLDEALNVAGGNIHFVSTGDYPWKVIQEGDNVYAQSGNAGVASSTSTLTATVTARSGDILFFDFKAWGEGTSTFWDRCSFSINGIEQIAYGAYQNEEWETYSVYLPAGECTLEWRYSKDNSVDKPGDYFAIDNVAIISAVTRGDVNGDGSVDISDVTDLIAAVLNGTSLDPAVADMNGDNHIDVTDVTDLISRVLNGA